MPEYQSDVDPPGGYDCQLQPGDERTGIRDSNTILRTLDDMLQDSGGAYSPDAMPIKQAIQYSLIALNRQTNDALMKLVQQLAGQIVGRVQYAEDGLDKLAAPYRRTIRGLVKRAENATNQLLRQIGNAVTARTAYNQQMYQDLLTRMLGGEPPSGETPPGEGETGIPSQSPQSGGSAGPGTPGETSPNQQYSPGTSPTDQHHAPNTPSPSPQFAPNRPDRDCPVFDICPDGFLWQFAKWWWQFEYPKLIHCLCQKQNICINVVVGNETKQAQAMRQAEWQRIAAALESPDPDKALQDEYDTKPTEIVNILPVIDYQFVDNPVNLEHFVEEQIP